MRLVPPTTRLYLDDDHAFEADATVLAATAEALACDRTCFYPGGGGQPPDQGTLTLASGEALAVVSARADDAGVVWHVTAGVPPAGVVGERVQLRLDRERRWTLTRHHTALHVLNTLALREHGGWITGAQIGTDHSRVDFKLDGLSPALAAALEAGVNAVLATDHALRAYTLSEEEFRGSPELMRTLEVQPPVVNGRVRVVEIVGFDAQACGGTHARTTGEVGRVSIYRIENKGRLNKRLYIRLTGP
jgi:misacylated tRNA(Ala) deacylase